MTRALSPSQSECQIFSIVSFGEPSGGPHYQAAQPRRPGPLRHAASTFATRSCLLRKLERHCSTGYEFKEANYDRNKPHSDSDKGHLAKWP